MDLVARGEISDNLKYRHGVTAWRVYHKGNGGEPPMWFDNFNQVKGNRKGQVRPTMFHETYTDFNKLHIPQQRHADPFNLRRCLRFYP